MATARTQVTQPIQPPQTPQLCDLCHLKPKFGNHQYCSKTCASQAATLCKHCHKKPKFQTFDYCGKHCASLANSGGNGMKPRAATGNNVPKKGNNTTTNNNNNQQPTIDPVQIAQLVAKHVPQLQSLLASAQGQGSSSTSTTTTQPTFNNSVPNAASQAAQTANGTRSVPFFSRKKEKAQPQLNVSTKQTTDDLRCIIPGCKQPGYVDEEGLVSDFCSLRHREEAVTSGLMSPCIMCLVLPQSDVDYFCSKACRDESMNKQYDDDGEEWSPAESQKPRAA